jgi:hypothetical protein
VNILKNLKSNGAYFGLCLVGAVLYTRPAAAEVVLVEKDGWRFTFDGRVNAFLSVGKGDDFPKPTPNPSGFAHEVMGSNHLAKVPGIGWKSSEVADENNHYFAARVRSGMVGNVLGFGITKDLTPNTQIKGYISIWSTIETEGRDKWAPVIPQAHEGYFSVTGPWGSATIGRTFGWFGRMSEEIDMRYGHGYGVGLPCTDELGPACGHTGTGVIYPGYSAGFSYSTPSLGGFQLHAGLYDPIVYAPDWKRAPMLRPEGAATFEIKLGGGGLLKLAAEGLYQPLARLDDATKTDQKTAAWGGSGGARLEVGPVRLGASFFKGKGVGITYALQATPATLDATTHELRTSSGVYGQAALMLGKLHLAAGAGVGAVDQLASDRANTGLSMIQRQIGVSAAAYYHASDSVVLGLDYFRFMARWYGAPVSDATGALSGTTLLPGEKQDLNFINAGVTYHW